MVPIVRSHSFGTGPLLAILGVLMVVSDAAAQSLSPLLDVPWSPHLTETEGVAWGDLDGDGDLDLVIASTYEFGPHILAFNEDGTFADQVHFFGGNMATRSVALGDVDGDGALDVVFGRAGRNVLLLNRDGSSPWTEDWSSGEGYETTEVALGDLDDDGDLDLICANRENNTIYENLDGTISLDPVWYSEDSNAAEGLAVGDVNGDGHLDLVFASRALNTVYFNPGNGTFLFPTTPVPLPQSHRTMSIALGDVDGDGDLDLVCANSSQPNTLYENDGNGNFSATSWTSESHATSSVSMGDVDGDGWLDLLFGNDGEGNTLYLNQGGAFDPTPNWSSTNFNNTRDVALADFDGDGRLDLACANLDQPPTLYWNDHEVFSLTPDWETEDISTSSAVALADLDGDGYLDLVFANNQQPNEVYFNQGTSIPTTPDWNTGDNENSDDVAAGDIDLDGDIDLVFANRGADVALPQKNALYWNTGGSFDRELSDWSEVYNTTSVVLGDLDNDGDLDLVCGNGWSTPTQTQGQNNTVYKNTNGSFVPGQSLPGGRSTHCLVLGDVGRDLDLDLVEGNAFRDNGNGQTNRLFRYEFGELWPTGWESRSKATRGVDLGDIDGDGFLDLACGNTHTPAPATRDGLNTIYEGEGDSFDPEPSWEQDPDEEKLTNEVLIEDVDGDGDLDVIWANRASENTIFQNDGGTLTQGPTWQIPSGWSEDVALGDVDNDGDMDLVYARHGTNQIHFGTTHPIYSGDPANPTHHLANNPSLLEDIDVVLESTNTYRVEFTAIDAESDSLMLRAEYRLQKYPHWIEMDVVGATPVGPFPASPSGERGSFIWKTDTAPRDRMPVIARLRVVEKPCRVSVIQHAALYVKQVDPIDPRRARLMAMSDPLVFRTITVGDTAAVEVTISNVGNELLTVSQIDFPSTEMSVDLPLPIDLDPGVGLDLQVILAPENEIDVQGSVVLYSNDPISPTFSIPVTADIRDLTFGAQVVLPEGETPQTGQNLRFVVTPGTDVNIESARLFYRPGGSVSVPFPSSRPFFRLENPTQFFAEIPGNEVTEEGLEYYIEVQNSGVKRHDPPEGQDGPHTLAVQPPSAVTVVPRATSDLGFQQGRDIPVDVTLQTGATFADGTLFFRLGGASDFVPIPFEPENPPSAFIPGIMVDSRGVEYWAEIRTATTTLSVGGADDWQQLQVTVDNVREQQTGRGNRFRMVSIPVSFLDTDITLEDLLLDQAEFGPYDPRNWRAFRYLGGENRELSPETSRDFQPVPGRGFWLISRKPHQIDTAPLLGLSPPLSDYAVPVEPGWTQIGNPFAFPVAWSDVNAPSSVSDPTVFDPSMGGAGDYADDPALVLMPFEAYFVNSTSAVQEAILVPPVAASDSLVAEVNALGTPKSRPVAKGAPFFERWSLTLVAIATPEAQDRVRVGVDAESKDGLDSADGLKPPPVPGPWVKLAVDNSEWTEAAGHYRRDVRAPSVDGHRWDLVVRSGVSGGQISVAGLANAEWPEQLHLRLVDREQGTQVDLRDSSGEGVRLLSYGPDRDYRLTLLAGTEEYVTRESQALTSIPGAVVLDQNAPNPFNPATRFRFGLPRPTRVRLDIYNIRGERVTSLIDGEDLSLGYHTRIWDGRNRRGQRVASGIYVYRLVTGEKTLSRKMVLMQ